MPRRRSGKDCAAGKVRRCPAGQVHRPGKKRPYGPPPSARRPGGRKALGRSCRPRSRHGGDGIPCRACRVARFGVPAEFLHSAQDQQPRICHWTPLPPRTGMGPIAPAGIRTAAPLSFVAEAARVPRPRRRCTGSSPVRPVSAPADIPAASRIGRHPAPPAGRSAASRRGLPGWRGTPERAESAAPCCRARAPVCHQPSPAALVHTLGHGPARASGSGRRSKSFRTVRGACSATNLPRPGRRRLDTDALVLAQSGSWTRSGRPS
jgi:hypothetical protein